MKIINVTNHRLMASQLADIEKRNWELVELPKELKHLWGHIPPEFNRAKVNELVRPITEFIHNQIPENEKGFILLSGDFCATFSVFFQIEKRITAIHSTMNREKVETTDEDGKVRMSSVINHLQFREL